SGAKDRRPSLDQLLADAKRRRFDVLVCWRLDRLGRSLKHLITLLDELQSLGVAFVSLAEGIDATTPAGKLQMHILGAIAEFERERIRERVMAGLQRARTQGHRLGRPSYLQGHSGIRERVLVFARAGDGRALSIADKVLRPCTQAIRLFQPVTLQTREARAVIG